MHDPTPNSPDWHRRQHDRRAFLRGVAQTTGVMLAAPALLNWLSAQAAEAIGDPIIKNDLLVRSRRPIDLETRLSDLTTWITPNDRFFVRSHFDAARVDPAEWRLRIDGMVAQPLTLSLDQIKAFEKHTVTAILQCAGNGRALFRPNIAGAPWETGAVGNARWTGARLVDVLKAAGIKPEARHVWVHGADSPYSPTTPAFIRNLPCLKALHPDTLLAYEMNGEPLHYLHGAPLRVVAPGWLGNNWVKWVTNMTVSDRESDAFFYKTAYRYPNRPVKPGEAIAPADMLPMEAMRIKSLITFPIAADPLPLKPVDVTGVAWTGADARITQVEVSTDRGKTWKLAELVGPDEPYAWRQWRYRWTPAAAGTHTLTARATDTKGETQPVEPAWNPSGYHWNGYHLVDVQVQGT